MLILTEDAEITGIFKTSMNGYNVGTDPYVKHWKNLGLMKSSKTLQRNSFSWLYLSHRKWNSELVQQMINLTNFWRQFKIISKLYYFPLISALPQCTSDWRLAFLTIFKVAHSTHTAARVCHIWFKQWMIEWLVSKETPTSKQEGHGGPSTLTWILSPGHTFIKHSGIIWAIRNLKYRR